MNELSIWQEPMGGIYVILMPHGFWVSLWMMYPVPVDLWLFVDQWMTYLVQHDVVVILVRGSYIQHESLMWMYFKSHILIGIVNDDDIDNASGFTE